MIVVRAEELDVRTGAVIVAEDTDVVGTLLPWFASFEVGRGRPVHTVVMHRSTLRLVVAHPSFRARVTPGPATPPGLSNAEAFLRVFGVPRVVEDNNMDPDLRVVARTEPGGDGVAYEAHFQFTV